MFLAEDENQDVIYEQHIISHNGKKFLLVLGYEGQSKMKLVYFYPIKQFQKPIMDVVVVILIISVIMMLIIYLKRRKEKTQKIKY